MAITAKLYANGFKHLVSDVLWTTDTIKATLHGSAYTPNQATDEFFSAVTNELATGNGYTAGGVTLASKSVTLTGLAVALKAAASVWTAAGGPIGPARFAVLRKDTGSAATSPVLGWVDFGADASATGATFTITWDAVNGALQLTAT